MRRVLLVSGLCLVLAVGGYLSLLKREAMADNTRGYPRAKSPHECAELFKKAVAARRYDKAARYCTKDYAEQLTRGADAARALGEAIDDLNARLEPDPGSELDLVLFHHDPLSPRLTLTVKTAGAAEAPAVLGVADPRLAGYYPPGWEVDVRFAKALYAYVPATVRLVRQDDQWKIDVPVGPEQRAQVDTLIANHGEYVRAFKALGDELEAGRTSRPDAGRRLRELLAEAVRARK